MTTPTELPEHDLPSAGGSYSVTKAGRLTLRSETPEPLPETANDSPQADPAAPQQGGK